MRATGEHEREGQGVQCSGWVQWVEMAMFAEEDGQGEREWEERQRKHQLKDHNLITFQESSNFEVSTFFLFTVIL